MEVNGTRAVLEWETIIDSVLKKGEFAGMTIPGPMGKDVFLGTANPTSPISLAFSAQHQWVSGSWPYNDTDFARADETEDAGMYSMPRFVNHLDSASITALQSVYSAAFSAVTPGFSVL